MNNPKAFIKYLPTKDCNLEVTMSYAGKIWDGPISNYLNKEGIIVTVLIDNKSIELTKENYKEYINE